MNIEGECTVLEVEDRGNCARGKVQTLRRIRDSNVYRDSVFFVKFAGACATSEARFLKPGDRINVTCGTLENEARKTDKGEHRRLEIVIFNFDKLIRTSPSPISDDVNTNE